MTNVPALKAERYYVYPIDGEPYEARLLWGDNLRAEMEGNKRGVKPQQSQFLFLTLTVWAEAIRTKRTELKFNDWQDTIEAIEDATKADRRAGLADADPGEADPT